MQIQMTPTPDEATAAALAAAIACVIGQDSVDKRLDSPPHSSWRAAGMLAAQGLPPSRDAAMAAWRTAERARRAERWSYGIVGM